MDFYDAFVSTKFLKPLGCECTTCPKSHSIIRPAYRKQRAFRPVPISVYAYSQPRRLLSIVSIDTISVTVYAIALLQGPYALGKCVAVLKRLGHAQLSITFDILTNYILGDNDDLTAN